MARRRGVYLVRGLVRRLSGARPGQGLPGEEEDLTPPWGIEEGERPEVEPPELEDLLPEHPIFPVEPGAPEIWPPLDIVPPMRPVPEYFYIVAWSRATGVRYVKVHAPTLAEQVQAIKDRLGAAGGIGGRPPQRPEPGDNVARDALLE